MIFKQKNYFECQSQLFDTGVFWPLYRRFHRREVSLKLITLPFEPTCSYDLRSLKDLADFQAIIFNLPY